MADAPVVAETKTDVCASDPNFAVIFAFCERFGDSCGITIPTFQELQEMLEKTNEVPDALVDLHIKLLRRVRKSVHAGKWEKAILKFCQIYSIPEFWELEQYGYKGISIPLKLRILKTLFEAQFDSNVKFKAEINKLGSSTLRSQPLGWDKSGTAYWVQFDRAYNLRVYKEDGDEDTWEIVANDRSTLVNLINELSGTKNHSLDLDEENTSIGSSSDADVELSQNVSQENNSCTSSDTAIVEKNLKKSTNDESDDELKKNICNSKEISSDTSNNLITKLEKNCVEENDLEKESDNNVPIVGEAIEESVMIVKGEGLGQECDTGNPDETDTQNETSKSEDIKKPKLWSIETICSSSKEVQEEVISVPTTGFFFGDNSVQCFSNVHNGEKSCLNEKKIEVDLLKANDEELNNSKTLNEIDSSSVNNVDNESNQKNKEEFSGKHNSKQSIFNIKVHEKEIQITEHNVSEVNEVYTKPESFLKNDVPKANACESTSVDIHNKSQLNSATQRLNTNENDKSLTIDEIDKCGTNNTICTDTIIEEPEMNTAKEKIKIELDVNDSVGQKPTNDTIPNIDMNKETAKQQKSSMLLEENKKENTELQTENKKENTIAQRENIKENTELQIKNKKEKTKLEIENKKEETELQLENIKEKTELQMENINEKMELQIENKKEKTELQNENNKAKTELQKENDKQLNTEIVNHTIEIDDRNLDDGLQINKQSTSVINESDLVVKKGENDECIIFHEQIKVDVEEKQSKIDKIMLPTVVEPSFLTDAKISTNVCSIIYKNKESKFKSPVEDNERDKEKHGSNDVVEQIEIIDDLKLNTSTSIDNIDQLTECNKLKLKSVDCSSSTDQIVTKDDSQCLLTHQQINYDQNDKKHTSHNIRNIISDHVVNEQLTDVVYDNKQLNKIQMKNENSLLQEKNKSFANADCQKVSNKKHVMDTIEQKSDQIKEISKINNLEKEKSDVFKINDKLGHCCDVDNDKSNIIMDKSKKNIKELKTKSLDSSNNLTVIKEELTEVIEMNKNIKPISSSSVQKQNEIIDENCSEMSTKQFKEGNIKQEDVQVNCMENKTIVEDVKPNEVKKEKNETNVVFEEKLNSVELKSDICSKYNVDKNMLETTLKTNEECTDAIPENDENVTNKNVNLKTKGTKVGIDKNIMNKNLEVVNEGDKLTTLKEDTDVSPAHENMLEEANKTKEDTLIKSPEDEFNNSEMMDQNDDKKNEDNIKTLPKKKGRPSRKKVNENIAGQTDETNDNTSIGSSKEEFDNKEMIDDNKSEENTKKLPKKRGRPGRKKIQENLLEHADETNKGTFIESSKDVLDDSEMVDQTNDEDDNKSEEDTKELSQKKGRPIRKKGKRGRSKNISIIKEENKSNTEEKVKRQYKPRQKKVVTIAEEVTVFPIPAIDDNKRRSRRIAEIKIKEQVVPTAYFDDVDVPVKNLKKKDKGGKKGSSSKKMAVAEESDDEDEEDTISKKFQKKKRKGKSDSLKKLNVKNPWNVDSESSSSENNIELFEDYDHEEEDEIPRPGIEPNVSDHEFSPESDINDDDEEYLPEKRARTAHKKDQDEELKDDMACKNCNKSDQPEWILLCDTCNHGWHASCLRPPLLVIPDGDWYCPPCRHEALLNALKDVLKKYDAESKKRENEELRRKRLAYVGISLQNVIPSTTEEVTTQKQSVIHDSSEDDESESESESESDDSEPLYQLRARRQTNVSYRFNDYDDMINDAILEETGVDESAIKKSADIKTNKKDNDENTDSDNDGSNKDREDSPIAPALLHLRGRKKSKKLTNLDISSDDGSDEDFKGPSDEDDDFDEDMSEYSDDSVKKRPQPTRWSVRNRKTVVDPDFINDDSSDDNDRRSKAKRSRTWSDSSNSEEEDFTWGKKKSKRVKVHSSSFSHKRSKKSKRKHSDSFKKTKKSKIKYGMDSDSDDQPQRKTRGRQITYAESDDSEEEVQTKKRKVASDNEDEYVLSDEELEAENEDHNLEMDNEEEKVDEDSDEEEEEAVGEEEEEKDEEGEDDEENNTKPLTTSLSAPPLVNEPPPTTVIQSVINEPDYSGDDDLVAEDSAQDPQHKVHQQLLSPPPLKATVTGQQQVPPTPLSPNVNPTAEKRKRPPKKSLSPNPFVDYSSGGAGAAAQNYPYPPNATKVMPAVIPPPPVHVYHRPSPTSVSTASVGFKHLPVAGVQPHVSPYRTSNKAVAPSTVSSTTQPTFLPPPQQQLQQVYQTPQQAANYSPYPIDYAAAGSPLPPPAAVAFRNVVVAPPTSHQESPTQTHPTIAVATSGGESEFGGLVSYFSSQQEDDFDT